MLALAIIHYYWEGMMVSYLYSSETPLPFGSVKEMYEIADQYRLALKPNTAWEDDFKYSSNPLWRNVYSEKVLPHYNEYLDNPLYFLDMAEFVKQSNLALYLAYSIVR